MLRYTRCNIMILMAATVLHFLYCVCISFVYHTFQVSPEKIPPLWGHLKSKIYEWNPHMIQEMKDNINHAVAAIKITMLHRVYLNMIRRAQLCVDAGGNHVHHLLWWYILSPFGYCINFCVYAMLWTRTTFSWHTLYNKCINCFTSVWCNSTFRYEAMNWVRTVSLLRKTHRHNLIIKQITLHLYTIIRQSPAVWT